MHCFWCFMLPLIIKISVMSQCRFFMAVQCTNSYKPRSLLLFLTDSTCTCQNDAALSWLNDDVDWHWLLADGHQTQESGNTNTNFKLTVLRQRLHCTPFVHCLQGVHCVLLLLLLRLPWQNSWCHCRHIQWRCHAEEMLATRFRRIRPIRTAFRCRHQLLYL